MLCHQPRAGERRGLSILLAIVAVDIDAGLGAKTLDLGCDYSYRRYTRVRTDDF